jgi:antitoxin (DNA-binding transcriptional repressor) of toxin-antitoxin stability system
MQVTLQYAIEHLDELASAADNGEDVEIARPEKPSLKLVVSERVPGERPHGPRILGALRGQIARLPVPERPRSELFGSLAGKITIAPDWNSDETNLEIEREFEGGDELQAELPV